MEDPGQDGRKRLRWIKRKWDGGKDWMGLAQHMDMW